MVILVRSRGCTGQGAAARQCVPVHRDAFIVAEQSSSEAVAFVDSPLVSPTASASFTIARIAACEERVYKGLHSLFF